MRGFACRRFRRFSMRSGWPTRCGSSLPSSPRSGCGSRWRPCRAARSPPISSTIRHSTTASGSPYGAPDGREWPDNHRRFALLAWVAAALGTGADPNWRPDIVHGHDWHAGLAPAYLRAEREEGGASAASVFTVHNLAYHGSFPAGVFPELSLPAGFFGLDGVEFYGGASFLKAGLAYADRLTTVSPNYAREIQTPEFGEGFDGLLRARADSLTGILNGVDPRYWDPEHDDAIPLGYTLDTAEEGKAAAKAALRRRLGLHEGPAPVFGVARPADAAKGAGPAARRLAGLDGRGRPAGAPRQRRPRPRDRLCRGRRRAQRGAVGVEIGYDETLARLVIAGSDCVVVPSRFEPCGLTQLYALRYGTLPLVRRTGGLVDTVVDATPARLRDKSATGFMFETATAEALAATLEWATAQYANRASWRQMMRQAMTQDFSWTQAARQYAALYRALVAAS